MNQERIISKSVKKTSECFSNAEIFKSIDENSKNKLMAHATHCPRCLDRIEKIESYFLQADSLIPRPMADQATIESLRQDLKSVLQTSQYFKKSSQLKLSQVLRDIVKSFASFRVIFFIGSFIAIAAYLGKSINL